MGVPKRKVSKSRRDMRSANKGLQPNPIGVCSNCSAPALPHYVCQECGYFRGEKVLRTKGERSEHRQEIRRAAAEHSAPAEENVSAE